MLGGVPDTIQLGTFTPSVLLRVARRTGRLAAAGLDVAESPVPSSPAQFAALLGGTLDAVLTSPDNVLAYRYSPVNPLGRTADVRILAAVDRGMGLALYSRDADLAGATFGVDVPGSGFAFAMYALAESLGLARDDYRVVALGSTPKRLTALLAGECAATMLNAGNELHAEEAGFRALARASVVCGPYLGTVLGTVRATLRPVHIALAGALTGTAAAIVAGELDQDVLEEAGAALDLSPALAARYLARLKDPAEGLVADGVVDPASIRVLVDLRRRYGPDLDGDPLAAALDPGDGLIA
jgi:ABC-type nitrate/sulfonate/bicarbonate transport system substrate-binding protein